MWGVCSMCLAFCCYVLRIAFVDRVLQMDFLIVEGTPVLSVLCHLFSVVAEALSLFFFI